MANDTFVHNWLNNDESDKKKIIEYLGMIKNKYNMFNTFLVSSKTLNYYTQEGFIETLSTDIKHNNWYFEFIKNQGNHQINLDFNNHLSNSLIMFINYKILDNKQKLMGATGIAIKIKYINDMLKLFRQKYGFNVIFFNENGKVVLSEKEHSTYLSIDKSNALKPFKEQIISKVSNMIEFKKGTEQYFLHTKYIPELNLYLGIEAKVSKYTSDLINTLYLNLIVSLIITLFIILIVFNIIKKHNIKLSDIAYKDPLTNIYNRRFFGNKLQDIIKNINRSKENFCIVFLDIDNFKNINDIYGHAIGDIVLKHIAKLLEDNIRETDIIARWGGEELVILLTHTNIESANIITNKLREELECSNALPKTITSKITASFGVTEFKEKDDVDTIIKRADEAMYISKNSGKNKVTIL